MGERRIGVAVSDPTGTIVNPVAAIRRVSQEADIRAVTALAGEYEAEAIVVGLPISLKRPAWAAGPACTGVHTFPVKRIARASPRHMTNASPPWRRNASSERRATLLHGRRGSGTRPPRPSSSRRTWTPAASGSARRLPQTLPCLGTGWVFGHKAQRLCRACGRESLHLDLLGSVPRMPEVIGRLHGQPGLGGRAERQR